MKGKEECIRQLLEDIEKYFDCALTDGEERELHRRIARVTYRHPAIDEARALMGFAPVRQCHSRTARMRIITVAAGIAAALTLLVGLGFGLYSRMRTVSETHVCMAYSGGRVITDEEAVLELMTESLNELNDGAYDSRNDLIDDIGLMAPAVDRYLINFDPVNELL